MTIKQEMKKIDMINIMLDNDYPPAWLYAPFWMRKNKDTEECRKAAIDHLQYHELKENIYKMFRNYLYWKIENDGKCW